jgi:hypothetical protein
MVFCGTSGLFGGRRVDGFADNILIVPAFVFAAGFFAVVVFFVVDFGLAICFFSFD